MKTAPDSLPLAGEPKPDEARRPPSLLAPIWIISALAGACLATHFLQGQFPIFTIPWLVVPLISVLRSRDARRIGLARVSLKDLVVVTLITVAAQGLITAPFEYWTHTGRKVYEVILAGKPPDATFLWVGRFPGVAGWAAMIAYSGLVTIFAEELFFRGWLLQLLLRRFRPVWAILIQATIFTVLVNGMLTAVMPPLQAAVCALVYSWLGIGVVCGWAAVRTRSIWPGLIVNVLGNAIGLLGASP